MDAYAENKVRRDIRYNAAPSLNRPIIIVVVNEKHTNQINTG